MTLESQLGELQTQLSEVAALAWGRFMEMVLVPVQNPEMLWAVVPLVIAVTFMTLYFGRYRGEELGWNDAFGNTMIFLFTAIALIKQMYYDTGSLSPGAMLANPSYLILSLVLAGASALLMFITYFRLLPKKLAFFLFSAPPVNVSLYVVITIIYAGVPADWITLLSALLLLAVILVITEIVKLAVFIFLGYRDRSAEAPKPKGGVPSHEKKKEERPGKAHAPADDTGVDLKILSEK